MEASAQSSVSFDAQSYRLKNWSTSGFLAERTDGLLVPSQRCAIRLLVQDEDFKFAFDMQAEVVRVDANGVAGRFVF
jgi:hypothetical protein